MSIGVSVIYVSDPGTVECVFRKEMAPYKLCVESLQAGRAPAQGRSLIWRWCLTFFWLALEYPRALAILGTISLGKASQSRVCLLRRAFLVHYMAARKASACAM